MATGTITWSAPIQGVMLETFEFALNQFPVMKAEIKTENESQLGITFTLQDVFRDKDAKIATRELVEVFTGRIALEFACQIGEAQCNGYSLPMDSSGAKHFGVVNFKVMYEILEASMKPSAERVKTLIAALQQLPSPGDRNFSLFRFSVQQQDPVTRFMFLYNLLLSLNDDKQVEVDDCILSVDQNVPVTEHPQKQGARETLFTRLRNEVAHMRQGSDLPATVEEVTKHIGWFKEIVRKVLIGERQ